MPCRERQLLFDKYRSELETHARNLQKLCDVVGSIPHVEFMVLWKTVQRRESTASPLNGFSGDTSKNTAVETRSS